MPLQLRHKLSFVKATADDACSRGGPIRNGCPLIVAILYEGVPAGQHAIQLVCHLCYSRGVKFEFPLKTWSFELLCDPEWREVAAADAVQAQLLVVASHNPNPLPRFFQNWLKACLKRKRGTAAGMMALISSSRGMDKAGSPRLQWLQTAARQASMDFFAPTPGDESALEAIYTKVERSPALQFYHPAASHLWHSHWRRAAGSSHRIRPE